MYSYGSYYKYKDTDDFDLILETAAALTAKDIRIWAKRISSADISEEDYKIFIKQSQAMADKAKEKNIRLNFENHRVTLTDTTKSARKMLDDIGRDNVYIYWQPQADDSEEERIQAIKTLHDKITNIHVFNWDENFNRYPLIQAKAEWESYIKNLGGDRAYLLEFVKDDSIEQFKEDAKVLKNMLGG